MGGRIVTVGSYPPAGRDRAEGKEQMSNRREPWTPEEDAILQQAALAGWTAVEIAHQVGRSESAVRTRAHNLRILLGLARFRGGSGSGKST
jgi:DNA-binding NarL/FixJ family response regulator